MHPQTLENPKIPFLSMTVRTPLLPLHLDGRRQAHGATALPSAALDPTTTPASPGSPAITAVKALNSVRKRKAEDVKMEDDICSPVELLQHRVEMLEACAEDARCAVEEVRNGYDRLGACFI